MKRLLLLLSVCYTLGSVAQESYPLQAIERTSFYAEPVDPPTETALPSGNIAARDGGGNTVGLTTGELSVSGTGAAVYTVPIAVPQGIKGVAPTLALTYNSQSGNGIAGYGWHLAGLSVISRVGSSMYHNLKITEVNLTETDQFALDGQRLMLKEGKHGESGAVYETETFSQVRIKAVGKSKNAAFGPDYFEVLYPDGSKAYYGRNHKGNRSQSVLEYALSHWENAQGVSIEYYYTIENNHMVISRIEYGGKDNALHTVSFKYIARNRTESAYVGGVACINDKILSAITVTDNNTSYRDYELKYNINSLGYNRLNSVQEKIGGESHTPIEFKYWDSAKGFKNRNFKSKVSLEGVDNRNSAVVPLDLDGDNHTDFVMYPTIGEDAYKKVYLFDVFRESPYQLVGGLSLGYTFKDVFASKFVSSTGKLFNGQGFVTTHQEGDKVIFNTYAKTYVSTLYRYDTKEWKLPTYREQGREFCDLLIQKWIENRGNIDDVYPEEKSVSYNDLKFLSGDFNGDGLTDIIAIEYPIRIEVCKLDPSSFDRDRMSIPICGKCNYSTDYRRDVYWIDLDGRKRTDYSKRIGYMQQNISSDDLFWTMDTNGDGKTDIIHITNGSLFVYEMGNNQNLNLLYKYNSNYIKLGIFHPIAGDFNGDGRIDFLLPTADKSNTFAVLTNTGKGFDYKLRSFNFTFYASTVKEEEQVEDGVDHYTGDLIFQYIYYYRNYSLIPIDINNDGKTDIIQYESTKTNFPEAKSDHIRNILVFNNQTEGGEYFFTAGSYKELINGLPPHIIFSAPDERNRVMDISFFSGDLIETAHLQENNREDVLLREVHREDLQEKISYKPMVSDIDIENDPIYRTEIYSETYPYVAIVNMQSVRLVSKLEREGITIPKTMRYFGYYKAITNMEGLGFLGFTKIGSTNWNEPYKYNNQTYTQKVMNPHLRGALMEDFSLNYIVSTSSYIPTDYFQKNSYQYTDALSPNKVFKLQLTQQTTEDKLSGLTTTNNFSYDADGNLTEQRTQTDGYSQSTRVSYLPKSESPYFSGLPQQKETTTTLSGDSFSTAETFAYEKGLLTTHKTKGNGTGWRTTSYGYDEYGNVTEQTTTAEDGQQRTERYTYDPSHRFVTTHTDHEGQVTKFSYNNRGLLESETTPLGQSTLYAYDLWGRPTQTTNFLGKKTTMRYSFDGGIFKNITENEEGTYSAESYNTLGWLLEKESNDAFNNRYAVSYEYNGIGQQVAVSTPHPIGGASQKAKRTEYDVYGRPTTITSPEGKITRFTYDKLKTTADDGQQQVISTRDAQGNIVEHQDTGGTVRYTYFANGSLKTADYGGAIQKITQDGWGRKTSLTDPSAGRYTYQYDTWGNLIEETTPKGKTTFSYAQGTDRLAEKHITGDYTDMRIRYTYNADKMLTQIDNQNKDGNNDSYRYEYNGLKQMVQTTETNPQAVFTKNYTYDAFGRVQQETTTAQTAGKRVSSAVQYRYENGELIEMKTASGATLWKLSASNEYGQPLSLYKGKTQENLQYNSHFPKAQTVQREDTPLNVLQYDFNTQRGLLNHRTYSFYNQKEEFAYDTTDRLTRWGNATHQYDERGRITENSAMGTYEYAQHSYQQQKLNTNEAGETYLEKHPLPTVRYNSFKAPEQIYVKDKERISYEYNAFGERSHCYYGNAEVEKAKRPLLKHYSHDGSVEIVCNKTDNSTKFVFYLGGDAYSAPAILISDGETSKLYYLHRDYLGSIVMLTDEDGNIAERRHFDPWGQPIKVEDGAGKVLQGLTLLDRGFTGHEHLQTVGLIHMNGRLYDPALHRFLQPDNYVQDPFNTQNFNRYGYCLNNPLLYTDQNGELFLLDDLIVGVAGFAFGYVYHGITTGDWGWNAVGAGGLGAGTALLSYYTMGGFSLAAGGSLSGGLSFAGNYMLSSTFNSFMPSFNIPISNNFSFSASLGLGFGSGTLGLGLNTSLNYTNGDFSASLGWGIGSGSTGDYSGWGASARYKGWGLGYTRTNYSSADNQVVGGVSLYFRDVSFRLENDFFGDGHDRFRSNAFELTVGNFTLGSNLYNNDVGEKAEIDYNGKMLNGKPNRPYKGKPMGAWKEGQTYSSPLWIGIKGAGSTIYRFGYSHPMVQDRTQNVTHKFVPWARTQFFNRYDEFKKGFYNYTGFNNPYSLW